MRPRRRDAAPLQPQARPSCRLQVDAVAAPVAALERRAAVRGSAQQKTDAYRCPRCVRDAERRSLSSAGSGCTGSAFQSHDDITSASLRKRRSDTLVSLCEYVSRLKQLPRAMPAYCQQLPVMQGCAAATWDARLVKYSLPRMRIRRRRQIYRRRGRTERCAATRPLSRR